ncbi:MAG: hypothetical protein OJF49_002681 [Ktedonobacterales bacterium]|nr:MAG: hypothetical protein OJF49_002681 [Ktedonobacterales bacterium]
MATPTEAKVSVRPASDADREAASAFITAGTARGRASLALLRLRQGLLWVAVEESADGEKSEKLVGLLLATVQIEGDDAEPAGYIHELLVHPAYRRLGVAMHLLDAAERFFLEEQGFAQVYLVTSADNEAALRLYRSRGYHIQSVQLTKLGSSATREVRDDDGTVEE